MIKTILAVSFNYVTLQNYFDFSSLIDLVALKYPFLLSGVMGSPMFFKLSVKILSLFERCKDDSFKK